jgi:hypothetical protein
LVVRFVRLSPQSYDPKEKDVRHDNFRDIHRDEIQREITRYRVRTTPDTFVSQPSPDVSKRAQKFGKSRSVYNNELSSLSAGWGGRVLSQSADRKKHLKTLLLLMRRAAV